MDLDGKTVLIVGAGRGIGRKAAEYFADENANLVISSRSEAELMELEFKLNSRGAGGVLCFPADWTLEEDVARLVDSAVNEFGSIDILILAAGKGILKAFGDISLEEFNELINVNTAGAFLVLQKVLPIMKQQRDGRVVAIPGVLGKAPMMQASAYCAAKYALTGMIKCLRDEYKRFGIRFSLMHFGGVDTPFWDDAGMKVDRSKLLSAASAAKAVFNAATEEGEGVMAEVVLLPESHQII